jgi:tRNA(Arg) A34 adenosine deaminase TadA
MCSGAILLYKIPRVVVGENRTFRGDEELLRSRGVTVDVVQDRAVRRADGAVHPRAAGAVERGHWGVIPNPSDA